MWIVSEKINDCGVFIDETLARGAIKIGETEHAALNAELADITNGEVETVGQTECLKAWLAANGCPVDNVQKDTLGHALTRKNISDKARRVITLRRDGAHAAADKYVTMMNWRAEDGRAHGCFNYHGTSTGRWSSYGPQLQNLKKPPKEGAPADAIEAVKTGDLAKLKILCPENPLSLVGEVTRGAFVAAPGHRLIAADFSGIESRVLAWLAGESTKLQQWETFDRAKNPSDEPYFILGQKFGLPIEQARDTGKTGDLAFGFMGGVPAYRKFAPDDDQTTDAQIKRYQRAWHNVHPATLRFWGNINRAAINAVQRPGKVIRCNELISFVCDESFLRMKLPSGRQLTYPFPSLKTSKYGELTVVYMAEDDKTKKWGEYRQGQGAYGGTWTENAVSATARDIFAAAMLRLEAAGYPIVLHVHDEIVAEVPNGSGSMEEFLKLIITLPDWAKGLPIAAKVREGQRFCKITDPAPRPREPDDPQPTRASQNSAEPENTCEPIPNTEDIYNSNENTSNVADTIMDYTSMHNRDRDDTYWRRGVLRG